MKSRIIKNLREQGNDLISTLLKYGFRITAQDSDYIRAVYYNRDEDILSDDSVKVIEEKIKVELDFDDVMFKVKSFLTDEHSTRVTGDVSFAGRFPTIEEFIDTLENEYGLERIDKQ